MLWRISQVLGWDIHATDGHVGSIADFLFDDTKWTIRWAVVDTGSWLPGRKVLLPPAALGAPDPVRREFPVDVSRQKVSPASDRQPANHRARGNNRQEGRVLEAVPVP